jgi:hypothetical protein
MDPMYTLYEDRLPLSPVRVFSPCLGVPVHVRFLAEIRGLPTHYYARRTIACEGAACLPAAHKGRPIWKFYGPAEAWDEMKRLWNPVVLEVTENLEETLRGRTLRGEVWCLLRSGKTQAKSVVTGFYCETLQETAISRPFDVEPVLQRLFRVHVLNLGQPSPIPPRLMLSPKEGQAPRDPAGLPAVGGQEKSPEEKKALAEALEEMRAKWLSRGNSANGVPK